MGLAALGRCWVSMNMIGKRSHTHSLMLFSLCSDMSKLPFLAMLNFQSAGIAFSKMDMRHRGEMWKQARNDMLTSLPHILATICDLWSVVRVGQQPCLPVGSPQRLRRLILDLLSPIASFHQHALLAALSLVWLSRSNSLPLSGENWSHSYHPE